MDMNIVGVPKNDFILKMLFLIVTHMSVYNFDVLFLLQ